MLLSDTPSAASVASSSGNDDKSNLLRPMLVNSDDDDNSILRQKSVNSFVYNKFVAESLRYANSFNAIATTKTTAQQEQQISSVTPLTYDESASATLSSIIPIPVWNNDRDYYYDEYDDVSLNKNNAAAAAAAARAALVTSTTTAIVTPQPSPATSTSPGSFLSHRLLRHFTSPSSHASYFSRDNDNDDDSEYSDLIDIYRRQQQHRRQQHRHHKQHRRTQTAAARIHSSSTDTPLGETSTTTTSFDDVAQLPLDSSTSDFLTSDISSTSVSDDLNRDETKLTNSFFISAPDLHSLDRNQHSVLPVNAHVNLTATESNRAVNSARFFKAFRPSVITESVSYIIDGDDDESEWATVRPKNPPAPSAPVLFANDDIELSSNIVSVNVVSNSWTKNQAVDAEENDNFSDTSKSLEILRNHIYSDDSNEQRFRPAVSSTKDFELININSTTPSITNFGTTVESYAREFSGRDRDLQENRGVKYYPYTAGDADSYAESQISILAPSSREFFVAKTFSINPTASSFYQMMTTMVDDAISRNVTNPYVLPLAATTPSGVLQLPGVVSGESFMSGNSTARDLLEHFADSNLNHSHSTAQTVILGVIFILMIVVTVVGNLFVIAAVYYERPLRKMTCNYYIVSLAVSDLMLGAVIVPFSALYEVTGEWVFGDLWCTAWLSLDVLATTSSILGLMVISVDRYLAVTRPLNYYRYSSTKFVIIAVVCLWALSMLITTAPVFGFEGIVIEPQSGRVQCNVGGGLVWTLYSAVGSFFFPLTIMVVLNLRIYKIAERQSAALHEEFKRLQHIYSHLGPPEDVGNESLAEQYAAVNKNKNHNDGHNKIGANDSAFSNGPATTNNRTTNGKIDDNKTSHITADGNNNSNNNNNKQQRSSDTSLGAKARSLLSRNHVSTRSVHKMRRFSKQHRAAKTLSFVMACFTICWLPFFTIYLIEGIATHWNVNLIGPIPFKVAFWLGYFNSALNPFIYAVSNRDFRRAFQKLFHCYYCRDYSDWHDMMRKPSWALYHRPSSSITERTRLQQRQQQLQRQSTAYCLDESVASLEPATSANIDFTGKQQQHDSKAVSTDPSSLLPDGAKLPAIATTVTTGDDSAPNTPPASTTPRRSSTPDHQRVAVMCEELRQSLTTTTLPALQTIALSAAPFSRRSSSSIGVHGRADSAASTIPSPQPNVHSQLSVESPYIISSLEHQHRSAASTSKNSNRSKQKRPSIVVSPENANEMALAIYVGDEYDNEFFRSFAGDDDEEDENEDQYEGSYSLRPHDTTAAKSKRHSDKRHLFGKRRQISAPTPQSPVTTSVLVTGASPTHEADSASENAVKTTPRRKLSATITASASFLIRALQGHRHHHQYQPRPAENRTRRVSFSDHSIPTAQQRAGDKAAEHVENFPARKNLFWNSEPDAIGDDLTLNNENIRKRAVDKVEQDKTFTTRASRLARSLTMPVKIRNPFTESSGFQQKPSSAVQQTTANSRRVTSGDMPTSNSALPARQQRNFSDASDSAPANRDRRSLSPFPAECPRCGLALQHQDQQQYSIEESPASIVHISGGEPVKTQQTSNSISSQNPPITKPVLVCSVGINTEPIQHLYEQLSGPNVGTHSNKTPACSSAAHRKSRHASSQNQLRNSTSNNLSNEQQTAKQCGVQTSYSVFDMDICSTEHDEKKESRSAHRSKNTTLPPTIQHMR